MAYGLKYYKELTQPNGKVVRLEILEKGYEGASKEIGPVCQALRLDIQGDTEIDAPIVKTSLSMTFVDAPDHVDARTKKCGNWDEFYTSDATLWQVVVKAKEAQETDFTAIWGGYITPDSYTEVLQYRGSVTIVARDNIGHLSDFPFDAEGNADGMISLIELIREAWDKIESPMTLDDQAVANADWMLSDGVYAYDTYMNVSAFEDMNWYDALESALYAYGLVLRYTGNNNVSFYSLRNLPRMGAHEVEDISFIEPTFMSGAERELTPAVKRIEEAVEYKIESAIQPQVKHEDFTLNRDYYAYDYGSASGKIETGIVEAISNTDKTKGWANEADKTLFFDPNAYELSDYAKVQPYAETLKKSMYIAVNNVKNASLDNIDRFVTYGKTMRCQDFAYVFNLGMLIQWSGSGKISKVEGYSLSGMTYAVSMERLGITYYYAGEGRWQTSYKELNLELAGGDANNSVEIPIGIGQYGSPDPANFVIYIKRISYTRQGDEASGRGLYVAIQSLEIASPQTSPIFAKNNVNTAYDNTNNVILSRDPKIAPALNTVSLPALIQNGIFIKRGEIYDSAKSWAWDGQTPQQMAVYNHLQLLCYHAKPNNLLRGTIVNADVANMQVIWMWHGAEHMLVSGTLDLISGHIENAVLREFARYEDMWGMLEPADMPEVEGKSSTNVEGGVAASNEGARMTSTTTVNIGGGGGSIVLDTFMSDTSQNGVQNRVIKAYVDDSCSDLDTRLQAEVDNIETVLAGINGDIDSLETNKADNNTVTALAERVSANEGAIDALDKRVTDEEAVTTTYASWWADLKKYIKVEGGNVKIDTNLIVEGDTSSGGSGQDTPASGTVTGIKVSASETLTPNNAGIIDMVSVLSSIDVSDQLTAYAKTEDVNAALLTKQDTISDLATIRSGAALGASALQNITKNMVDSVLGSTTAGNANRFLMSTGSTSVWAAISKDMVTDALGYTPLSLSGGTISGNLDINTTTDTAIRYFRMWYYASNRQNRGMFRVNENNVSVSYYSPTDGIHHALDIGRDGLKYISNENTYTLIHSGNIGGYALKTDGSNSMTAGKGISWGKSTSATWNHFSPNAGKGIQILNTVGNPSEGAVSDYAVGLAVSGYYGFCLGYNALMNTCVFKGGNSNFGDWKTIAFTDSNVASAQALIHSNGTIGAVLNSSGNVTIGDSDYASSINRFFVNGGAISGDTWADGGQVMLVSSKAYYLALTTNESGYSELQSGQRNVGAKPLVLQKKGGNVLIGTTTDYGHRLQVNGDVSIPNNHFIAMGNTAGTALYQMWMTGNDVFFVGRGSVENGHDSVYCGKTIRFSAGNSAWNNSGTFDEYGNFHLTGAVTMSSTLTVAQKLQCNRPIFGYMYGYNSNAAAFIFDKPGSNLTGIGSEGVSDTIRFGACDVNGTWVSYNQKWKFYGDVIVTGDTSSGSDIRFKDIIKNKTIKIEDIAKAPLFTFKWNDREDDSIHLGSSAQYWEKVCPWLVKGEDFKTLDYSTLGVAMGISLAKKAVNHEERIKELEKENKELKETIRRIQYGN